MAYKLRIILYPLFPIGVFTVYNYYNPMQPAIFAPLVSIFVVISGFVFSYSFDQYKENKDYFEIKEYFHKLLRFFITDLLKLKEFLEEYVDVLSDEKNKGHVLKIVPDINLKLLLQVDHGKLLKMLLKSSTKSEKEINSLNEVFRRLDVASSQFRDIPEYFKDYNDLMNQDLTKKWNENITIMDNKCSSIILDTMRNKGSLISDEFAKGIDTIKLHWLNAGALPDLYFIFPNYVQPIVNHCTSFINDSRAFELRCVCLKCRDIYADITKWKEGLLDYFQNNINSLLKTQGIIESYLSL